MANNLTSSSLTVGSGSITGIVSSGVLAPGVMNMSVSTTGDARALTTLPSLSIGSSAAYFTQFSSRYNDGPGTMTYYRQGFRLPSSGSYRYELIPANPNTYNSDRQSMSGWFGSGSTGITILNLSTAGSREYYIVKYQRIS